MNWIGFIALIIAFFMVIFKYPKEIKKFILMVKLAIEKWKK